MSRRLTTLGYLQLPFNSTTYGYTHTEGKIKRTAAKQRNKHRKMGFASFCAERFKLSLSILYLFLVFILFCSSSFVSSQHSLETRPTAYEMLKAFDFPVGILPKGVIDYDLESSSGKFSAFLNGSCSFSLEGSYQLKYKPTIKGHISNGKISSLEGVSVKLFFMWVDIIEVTRHGDSLEFSVGIAGAGFPIDNFEECPQCGCGLNCSSEQVRKKMRTNLFVSSS